MNRKLIVQNATWYQPFILVSMLVFGSAALAQDVTETESDEAEATELDTLQVTGSRISRTDVEGPSPVIVVTSEQLEKEGFTTMYEALRTLTQNSNFGQTEGDGGTFTQNANALDLRGLGPGRTLLLLDGRRITDYPLPFNGQSNLQNLDSLPIAAIERIEVIAGGASAIYGSDAVAGVVNFITKKDLDSHTINLRYGDTSQGGGESYRLQASGGFMGDRWRFTYAAELLHRDPIWGFERDFMDSTGDTPDGDPPDLSRNPLWYAPFDPDGDGYFYRDPGQERCDALPYTTYSVRGSGWYCGQDNLVSQFTFRSERDNISLFLNGAFEVTDTTEIYGALNYWNGESQFTGTNPYWFPTQAGAYIFNAGYDGPTPYPFGEYAQIQRQWDLREIGLNANANNFDEDVTDIVIGARGTIWDVWDWDVYYNHQQYNVDRKRTLQLEALSNAWFVGEQLGSAYGVPIFEVPDQWRLWQPQTPEIWDSLTDTDHTTADSSNQMAQFVLTGDLFELPAGPMGIAAVLEWGSQEYSIKLDPRFGSFDPDTGDEITPNEWWGFTATGGGGKRDRYAAGLETRIPIFNSLTASAAVRYDKYDDVTEVDDAVTYNLGLEWRPTNNLLLRGSYATTFRAPDMHYVFAGPSGFFTTVTDQYRCRRDEPGVPFAQCTIPSANPFGTRQGNTFLEEEESTSYTVGFVWELTDNLSFSLDYWDIDLENMVADLSITNILEREADCRLGQTEGGEPVDINSLECRDALARVGRAPIIGSPNDEVIQTLRTGAVNRAVQHTSGIDAHIEYATSTANAGNWRFELAYTHTLVDEGAEFAGDPVENFRDDLQNFNWRSRMRGSVTWNMYDFTTTLFGDYRGSLPNWAETGRTGGSIYWNWSAGYFFTDNQSLNVIVQNVLDTNPKKDETFYTYPYFLFYNFDPTGREIFLSYTLQFD